ncbi:hypothetical protein TNCV_4258991 [Trichonephila clavipes]|nr:hypothetical protein TNCV_4258991 [Trichonephila clavipes]
MYAANGKLCTVRVAETEIRAPEVQHQRVVTSAQQASREIPKKRHLGQRKADSDHLIADPASGTAVSKAGRQRRLVADPTAAAKVGSYIRQHIQQQQRIRPVF